MSVHYTEQLKTANQIGPKTPFLINDILCQNGKVNLTQKCLHQKNGKSEVLTKSSNEMDNIKTNGLQTTISSSHQTTPIEEFRKISQIDR